MIPDGMMQEEEMMAEKTVERFIAANDESPVVYGRALEPDPHRPAKGAVYRFQNGRELRLTAAQCRALPEGYPKWTF